MFLKNKTRGRLFSFLSLLSILFQLLTPYLLFLPPGVALAKETIVAKVDFDNNTNEFLVEVNSKENLEYLLVYRQNEKNEAITGKVENAEADFNKKLFAGTCSANGACVSHKVEKGILKFILKARIILMPKDLLLKMES